MNNINILINNLENKKNQYKTTTEINNTLKNMKQIDIKIKS